MDGPSQLQDDVHFGKYVKNVDELSRRALEDTILLPVRPAHSQNQQSPP